MLNEFFIFIGDIFISFYNFFVNFKMPKSKSSEKNVDSGFLHFNSEPNVIKNEDDKFRLIFINYFMQKQTIAIIILITSIMLVLFGLELAGIFFIVMVMFYVFMLYYHKIREQRGYNDLNQELPYALRHMGIELKSGRGLHDTLVTVSNADYGSFSKELKRVLEEIKYGQSTENSLLNMSHRVNSEGLSRAVQQIVGTLRVGGNLANSLGVIAEDMSFDMQTKLKDYAQKLNAFILIYTFVAILAPVLFLIMLMAASTVMGDIISSNIVMILYVLFFPMVVIFMGVFIKRLEPKI